MTREQTSEITSWLAQKSLPIDCRNPEGTAEDWEPLREILDGVKIVGAGEATHGTKEFFQIRYGLMRFLVTELGFNTLAIEASYSATQILNSYISGELPQFAEALTGLGAVMWDVEEFARAVQWLRGYNASTSEESQVRLCGLDILNTHPGRERILSYLRRVAPHSAEAASTLFSTIEAAEASGVLNAHKQLSRGLLLQVRDLLRLFESRRDAFTSLASPNEYEEAINHLRIVLQAVTVQITPDLGPEWPADVPRIPGCNNFARSMYLAENMIRLMERHTGDIRAMVWAHNYHVGVGLDDQTHGPVRNMGQRLRERFGEQYYAFGLDLNRGTYLAREWRADRTPGELRVGTVPPAPKDSLSWHLARIPKSSVLLDLRKRPIPPGVEQWLRTPRPMYCISWALHPPLLIPVAIRPSFDGVIFVDDTTPTTPTPSALATAAQRKSH